ncbi:MAG TPA: hypothetical protein VJH22_00220 [Candidatus Nanoarchaeia archaeon]|nr:hypothetical protein [Candidatus Nanoarchaeia archaeon]
MFEGFIASGKVRKGTPDIALAKSLIAMSVSQLAFVSANPISESTASPILVNYYEALREICEAICAKNGYKVYSHEAYTSYLKEQLKEERISMQFDRLRKLRNGVNYYGEFVSVEETQAARREVPLLIDTLKKKHLSGL